MGCAAYEGYYFLEAEWKLLLASAGITRWYGLCSENPGYVPDEAECNRILANLYQKDIIDWEDGGIAINRPFSKFFSTLRGSRECITIKGKGEIPVRCCYIGETDVVVTEKSQRERDMLCAFCMAKDEFVCFVLEYAEIYPEGICREEEGTDFLSGEPELTLELRSSTDGKEKERLMLQEHGLQTYLIWEKGGEAGQLCFRRSLLEQYIKGWLNGKEQE